MERLSIEENPSEGSLDLYCMFSVVRQVLNSRCMTGQDAMSQLPGLSSQKMQKLKLQGSENLRQLVINARGGSAKSLPGKLLSSLKKIPLFSAENISLKFQTEKATGVNSGELQFDFLLVGEKEGQKGQGGRKSFNTSSFTVAVGTHQSNLLLVQKNIMMSLPNSQKPTCRAVTLKFDWNLANSHGGEGNGHVLLRILSTERRGMDVQYLVPLK
jgi:hypothetical protein